MPAPSEADLPRLHREIEALRLRNQLDPKRFYKKDPGEGKGLRGLPKFFQASSSLNFRCRVLWLLDWHRCRYPDTIWNTIGSKPHPCGAQAYSCGGACTRCGKPAVRQEKIRRTPVSTWRPGPENIAGQALTQSSQMVDTLIAHISSKQAVNSLWSQKYAIAMRCVEMTMGAINLR